MAAIASGLYDCMIFRGKDVGAGLAAGVLLQSMFSAPLDSAQVSSTLRVERSSPVVFNVEAKLQDADKSTAVASESREHNASSDIAAPEFADGTETGGVDAIGFAGEDIREEEEDPADDEDIHRVSLG